MIDSLRVTMQAIFISIFVTNLLLIPLFFTNKYLILNYLHKFIR